MRKLKLIEMKMYESFALESLLEIEEYLKRFDTYSIQ